MASGRTEACHRELCRLPAAGTEWDRRRRQVSGMPVDAAGSLLLEQSPGRIANAVQGVFLKPRAYVPIFPRILSMYASSQEARISLPRTVSFRSSDLTTLWIHFRTAERLAAARRPLT